MIRSGTVLTVCLLFAAACALDAEPPADAPASTPSLSVLTLNLHTYQELRTEGVPEAQLTDEQAAARVEAYGEIFDRIAAGIRDLDPDVICLQEVGEWAGGRLDDPQSVEFGAGDSNMVVQILARLDERYDVTMDWSHFGFDVWLEGSAVLSKHPLVATGSRWISRPANSDYENWKSRKVPMGRAAIAGIDEVNVFSVHTGWWDDADEPFQEQYARLMDWVGETSAPRSTTILCGDFNVAAGSDGHRLMTEGTGFADQFELAHPGEPLQPTIGAAIDGWEESAEPRRIDYILMNEDSRWQVVDASIVFTAADYGVVSDHAGVLARFVRRSD